MRLIAWLILFAALAPAAAAQTLGAADSLRVGTVALELGMPEGPTLGSLRRQFHVEHARSNGDDWAVIKDGKTVAVVSFASEKVSRVSKTWMTTGTGGASALADQLYSLAKQFSEQGRTECSLAAKPYRVGGVQGRIVTLACGSESIQLIQSRTQRSGWVTSLQEVLQ